ncbi:substrate-binding domain-containing protein [bacterium]|nr:substrate-binding domain-containing protein [bacterium]
MHTVSALALLLLASCSSGEREPLRLATTTSTQNSGLLEVLLPPFEKAHGVKVAVLAVGTGKALKLGENGDVDVVLVHAPEAEKAFVDAGFGVDRRAVMHNDFVIVGPGADPAGLGNAGSAKEAFTLLTGGKAPFISRGDESGTHKKERAIWRLAGLAPTGAWYIETGQGMGDVLMMANEKLAYTLTDRGTWLAYADKLQLSVVFQGDPLLHNPYGAIAVNAERRPQVQKELARKFLDYLTGPEAQAIIAGFRIRKNGEQLFHPDALK